MIVMPDLSKVIEWSKYLENRDNDHRDIFSNCEEAKEFLLFYDWCVDIIQTYVGMHYPGILSVFLFRIKPASENVDEWIWVIVGDVPPAYLTIDECPNPATALDGYIGAMEEWVDAAYNCKSVAELIPVNVPATKENADMLSSRLKFLDDNILSDYKDDLKE